MNATLTGQKREKVLPKFVHVAVDIETGRFSGHKVDHGDYRGVWVNCWVNEKSYDPPAGKVWKHRRMALDTLRCDIAEADRLHPESGEPRRGVVIWPERRFVEA